MFTSYAEDSCCADGKGEDRTPKAPSSGTPPGSNRSPSPAFGLPFLLALAGWGSFPQVRELTISCYYNGRGGDRTHKTRRSTKLESGAFASPRLALPKNECVSLLKDDRKETCLYNGRGGDRTHAGALPVHRFPSGTHYHSGTLPDGERGNRTPAGHTRPWFSGPVPYHSAISPNRKTPTPNVPLVLVACTSYLRHWQFTDRLPSVSTPVAKFDGNTQASVGHSG